MEFDVAGARKAGYSDSEIADYLGGQASFNVAGARQAGYSDSEIIGHLVPPERDFMRGAETAFKQTPALLEGLVGLFGATAEKAFGKGGISTDIKNWGLQGYEEGMQKMESSARPTDDVTVAWDRAKNGDWGAMVDWAEYALGYGLAQVGETAVTGLAGALAGGAVSGGAGAVPGAIAGVAAKGATKGFIKNLVERQIAKRAATLVEESAAKQGVKKLTQDEALKLATKGLARDIGAITSMTAYNVGIEGGQIYPAAVE